jgi:hypothetical protein
MCCSWVRVLLQAQKQGRLVDAKFEALAAVLVNIWAFWGMMLCLNGHNAVSWTA